MNCLPSFHDCTEGVMYVNLFSSSWARPFVSFRHPCRLHTPVHAQPGDNRRPARSTPPNWQAIVLWDCADNLFMND